MSKAAVQSLPSFANVSTGIQHPATIQIATNSHSKAIMLALLFFTAMLLAGAMAQPEGSNPGLPPSAAATGLAAQQVQVSAVEEIQAANKWSSVDLLAFLINGECLEAQFDSYGAFGQDLDSYLLAGGPPPKGAKKGNLSPQIQSYVEEVARNEAGHVRVVREALGADAPACPQADFTAFQTFMNNAFGTKNVAFDAFANDINFVLSMFALEEVGCGFRSTAKSQKAGLLCILWISI